MNVENLRRFDESRIQELQQNEHLGDTQCDHFSCALENEPFSDARRAGVFQLVTQRWRGKKIQKRAKSYYFVDIVLIFLQFFQSLVKKP